MNNIPSTSSDVSICRHCIKNGGSCLSICGVNGREEVGVSEIGKDPELTSDLVSSSGILNELGLPVLRRRMTKLLHQMNLPEGAIADISYRSKVMRYFSFLTTKKFNTLESTPKRIKQLFQPCIGLFFQNYDDNKKDILQSLWGWLKTTEDTELINKLTEIEHKNSKWRDRCDELAKYLHPEATQNFVLDIDN